MPSVYYRADKRTLDVIQKTGFQPKKVACRGRSPAQAVDYIKQVIIDNNYKNLADIGAYIISSAKEDSVSTSRVADGASYGDYTYQITVPDDALYFEFNVDGSLGAQLPDPPAMSGRKPYYILTCTNLSDSRYVIVGTRTTTQEATFFTDIPADWITLLNE